MVHDKLQRGLGAGLNFLPFVEEVPDHDGDLSESYVIDEVNEEDGRCIHRVGVRLESSSDIILLLFLLVKHLFQV